LIVDRAKSQSPGSCFAYPASATLAASAAVVEILLDEHRFDLTHPAGKPPGRWLKARRELYLSSLSFWSS